MTCSVLPEENEDQLAWFLANHSGFAALPWRDSWRTAFGEVPPPASPDGALLLTPARHGTDAARTRG